MNQTKIISRILFYICSILSAGYLITALYALLCLATGFSVTPYGNGQYLHINYPFTEQPFLNIEEENILRNLRDFTCTIFSSHFPW